MVGRWHSGPDSVKGGPYRGDMTSTDARTIPDHLDALFVGGTWVAPAGSETLTVVNPTTEEPLATLWISLLAFFDVVFVTLSLWTFEPVMTE